jgi:hypothetical protein
MDWYKAFSANCVGDKTNQEYASFLTALAQDGTAMYRGLWEMLLSLCAVKYSKKQLYASYSETELLKFLGIKRKNLYLFLDYCRTANQLQFNSSQVAVGVQTGFKRTTTKLELRIEIPILLILGKNYLSSVKDDDEENESLKYRNKNKEIENKEDNIYITGSEKSKATRTSRSMQQLAPKWAAFQGVFKNSLHGCSLTDQAAMQALADALRKYDIMTICNLAQAHIDAYVKAKGEGRNVVMKGAERWLRESLPSGIPDYSKHQASKTAVQEVAKMLTPEEKAQRETKDALANAKSKFLGYLDSIDQQHRVGGDSPASRNLRESLLTEAEKALSDLTQLISDKSVITSYQNLLQKAKERENNVIPITAAGGAHE